MQWLPEALGTNHGCMAMSLKPKPNHSNGSVQKSQDRKKHVNLGQMWRFCSLFSSIVVTWFIMNSCHKIVLSIRNIILKLCADYVKQFVKKAQNCGKTHHGFCTMIAHQITYLYDTCAWVFSQKLNCNHDSTTAFAGLDPLLDFFLFPKLKTSMKGKRFTTIEEIKEKSKQELFGDTKNRVSEVFRRLENPPA